MKKITQIILTILIFSLCLSKLNAQDGYTYTLQHNGGYNFTVQVVPNTSSNNFATSVQSYGFTIILPDGVTITPGTSLGPGASSTFFNGVDVAEPTIDGYLVTETLGSPVSLSAPSAATNSDVYTFTVDGSPISGVMYILENNSSLANTVMALKSFMQADMIDNGMAEFVNVVDPNASAVSGMSSFNFATLSIEDKNALAFRVFPNPVTNYFTVDTIMDINSIELYNILGEQILQTKRTQNIPVSLLEGGVYLIKILTDNGTITKRIIKR